MKLLFVPMTRLYAEDIACWRYDPPYDIYGHTDGDEGQSIDYLVDDKNGLFAVLHNGELIGFRSFGEDGRVSGGNYDGSHLDTGGGLRPDLTGKGLGAEVLFQGLQFATETFGTDRFRVTIAVFNERAQKVCRRLGFQESDRFCRSKDGKEFVIMTVEEPRRKPCN
jgi:RimJ/RimL family protein N-acetyltransferase